ncbi:MAG: hypothetical protein ACO236_00005, partial [Candidatus Nanopelagicaceae bacterium]
GIKHLTYAASIGLTVAVWDSRTNTTKYRHVTTSSNGTDWVARPLPAGTETWNCIAWSPTLSKFVVLSENPSDEFQVLTSSNGISWTKHKLNGISGAWNKVVWAEGLNKFIAVSSGGNVAAMYSEDGINWTGADTSSPLIATAPWQSVAYSPTLNRLVAVSNIGTQDSAIMTSTNGINWTPTPQPEDFSKWSDVLWCEDSEEFVACASYAKGRKYMTSVDGINWIARISYTTNTPPGDLASGTKVQFRHYPDWYSDTEAGYNTYNVVYPETPNKPPLQPHNPVSRGQRHSIPLTYEITQGYQSTPVIFRNNAVWAYDPNMITYYSEPTTVQSSLSDITLTIRYKIRVPAGIEAYAQTIKIAGGADSLMTATIRNPLNNQTATWSWVGIPSETNPYTDLTQAQIQNVLAPDAIYENNQWLDLTVTVKNNPVTGSTGTWASNPSAYILLLTAFVNGREVPIFNAREWSTIPHTVYGSSLWSQMKVPPVRTLEAARGGNAYGPLPITRDNGDPNKITDWFEVCKLGNQLPGTLVGLFVDRSGSMTQTTIQASYDYFYQRCTAAGLRVTEVQNGNEDWITPFIDEI